MGPPKALRKCGREVAILRFDIGYLLHWCSVVYLQHHRSRATFSFRCEWERARTAGRDEEVRLTARHLNRALIAIAAEEGPISIHAHSRTIWIGNTLFIRTTIVALRTWIARYSAWNTQQQHNCQSSPLQKSLHVWV
eukprot:TRINITY_DN106926_c0_g1_i1.p2 TRINITY_DN106926_c0_g1~~TRINITY_DN106926_c0_g1_i1.p2  ORF type:complete len:137 (+),score=7.47 TRINITY_DN106926_c0_g1_i1:420-830(+)